MLQFTSSLKKDRLPLLSYQIPERRLFTNPSPLYPSPHDMEMYSLHEREEDFLKGILPHKNIVFVGTQEPYRTF